MKDMTYKLEAFGDKNARRITLDEKVIALVMAYTNGAWAVQDINGKRIAPFGKSAKDAFNLWVKNA